MIIVAKYYCTTALLKCRRLGSYCYSIPFCLLLLTAALTAAISTAEVIYFATFIQKMRCTTVAAAPTAAAVAATAAATAAAAVLSFRFYYYAPLQCNYKTQTPPKRPARVDGTIFIKIFYVLATIISTAAAAAAATAAIIDQLHSILFGVAITSYAAFSSRKTTP